MILLIRKIVFIYLIYRFKSYKNLSFLDLNFRKIDFTNFLMELVRRDLSVNAVCRKFSWHEFDTMKDFKNFEKL